MPSSKSTKSKNKKTSTCTKCSLEITDKDCIKCSICNILYHLNCNTVVTIKRYVLMNKKTREAWKCHQCLNNASKNKSSTSTSGIVAKNQPEVKKSTTTESEDLPNKSVNQVTMSTPEPDRLSLSSLQTPDSSLNSSADMSLNNSIHSMPNSSESSTIAELRDTISILTTQLTSAHEEITNLNMDITRLTKNQADLERQVATLKSLLNQESPLRRSTPKPKKKKDITVSSNENRVAELHLTPPKNLGTETIGKNNQVITQKVPIKQHQKSLTTPPESKQFKTVYMYGGTQCVGLASKILHMRQDEKYRVQSTVKPEARTRHILEDIRSQVFTRNDKIILSVGEHDNDPIDLITNLNNALQYLRNYSVFILYIRHSKYLDNYILNYILRNCCSNENCKFIEVYNANLRNNKLLTGSTIKELIMTLYLQIPIFRCVA
ncbi:uncharacterized protein LOC133517542 [Cydia pomonella]|uniref:uncharacterized protein LOC133517542 n=1 Tax=Cydia pomonella TaxID=82600 RepID=UPI002ADD5428|nr:uncharacterized protein LOC133517542 [Cydia pomonella]